MKDKQHKINSEIYQRTIRLTGGDFKGELVSLNEAIALADEMNLDLVLFGVQENIGICKIINYEKFLYELGKKEKEKPKVLELKEIKIGPNISENDLKYRINHLIEFLSKGHKVKISMQFKGREMSYITNGETLMLQMILAVKDYGSAEAMPKLENKKMFVTIKPINKSGK